MKNLSLGLNALLTIAVIILFALHFSGSDNSTEDPAATTDSESTTEDETIPAQPAQAVPAKVGADVPEGFRIAIVNMDSLQLQYQMILDEDLALKREKNRIQQRLETAMREHDEAVITFQERAAMMTQEAGEKRYMELMQKRDEIAQDAQSQEMQLLQKQESKMDQIYSNIDAFISSYNAEHQYSLILSQTYMGEVLSADGAEDITKAIVGGLNAEYAASKSN